MIDTKAQEKSILASVMVSAGNSDKSGLADQMLSYCTETMFTDMKSRDIYRAVKECRDKAQNPDMVNVANYLQDKGNVDYLAGLVTGSATTGNIDTIIETLRTVDYSRKINKSLRESLNGLNSSKGISDLKENINTAERGLSEALGGSGDERDNRKGNVKDFLVEYAYRKQQAIEGKVEMGKPTGIPTYDTHTGGMRKGELMIVAGLPGMGKTSFLTGLIAYQVLKGFVPALFSFEMDEDELIDKLVCQISFLHPDHAPINYNRLRNPTYLKDSERASMGAILMMLKNSGLYINVDPSTTLQQVKTESRRHKADHGDKCGLFGVDYIQLMVNDNDNSVSEISTISRELKLLAGELKETMVALSQLNKRDAKKGERPHKGWLKGSGSLEQDANVILFPWREYAILEEGDASDAVLIKGKHRHWKGKDIEMGFDEITTTFYEKAEPEQW